MVTEMCPSVGGTVASPNTCFCSSISPGSVLGTTTKWLPLLTNRGALAVRCRFLPTVTGRRPSGGQYHPDNILGSYNAQSGNGRLNVPDWTAMTRRGFLAASAGSVGVALAQSPPPKRIAAIITEYWSGSHADVLVGKYLEGWLQDGRSPGPRSKIVSMYTEHGPASDTIRPDISRPMAAKYGVPISTKRSHSAATTLPSMACY